MPDIATPSGQLPEGAFVGRQAFASLIRQALQRAALEGWAHLWFSDPDFVDWPLGERTVIESLNDWARSGRQLQLLARDFAPLRLQHPRFVQWRTTWSHLVQAHGLGSAAAGDLPSALWSPVWVLDRVDPLRCTGVTGSDARRRVNLRERLGQAWSQGTPAFPASILGL